MSEKDTIVALASGSGKAALAIFRLSGAETFQIIERCVAEKDSFSAASFREIKLFTFINSQTNSFIDQVTIIKYKSPQSYTGEDMVELICHGGLLNVQEIHKVLIDAGARSAYPGEFSKRAFENGKMDLMKAESIHNLIDASNHISLEDARSQYQSKIYGKKLSAWKESLSEILSIIETEIEFNEDIGDDQFYDRVKQLLKNITDDLNSELIRHQKVRLYEDGIRILIMGLSNAGKSSIFNKILGYQRSIVDEEKGTTRDIVSEKILIGKETCLLMDSAGLRDDVGRVEAQGIQRAKETYDLSHIVLWVTAADEPLHPEENAFLRKNSNKYTIIVSNKADLTSYPGKNSTLSDLSYEIIHTSTVNDSGMDQLLDSIKNKISLLEDSIEIPSIIHSSRHQEIANRLYKEIALSLDYLNQPEILAHYINNALAIMDEFTGRTGSEDIMNKIFESFCIGK